MKVLVGAVALVVMAGVAFDSSDGVSAPAEPIITTGGGHGAASAMSASFSAGSLASAINPQCRLKPTLSQRGTMLATKAGNAVHALGEPIPPDQQQRFVAAVNGSWWQLGYWWGAFGRAVNGDPLPDPVATPVDCSGGAVGECSPTPAAPNVAAAAAVAAPIAAVSSSNFTSEQISIARTIVQVADERGLPEQAKLIALATGFVESGMKNLSYGDRDSVGVFQQRAGWGSVSERMDVKVAAGKFFDALVKVNGWQSMALTRAAQAVQISGFPDRYGQREADARAILAAVGTTPGTPEATPAECANPSAVIGSWNVAHWNSGGNVLEGVRELTARASVFGLQEVDDGDRTRIKKALPAGWRITDGWSSTPIVWDGNRYTYLGQEQKVVLKRTRVEIGSDGTTIPQKTMNTVELVDNASGVRFAQVNFHLPPSTGPDNGKDSPAKPRRLAAYRLEKSRVIAKVQELRAQGFSVAASCDCNRSDDLDGSFAAAGMVPSGTQATHGSRTLDWIYVAGMTPSAEEVLSRGYGSDHDAVLATFTSTQPKPIQPPGASDAAIGLGGNVRAVVSEGKTYQIPIPAGPQGMAINYALDQIGKPYVWAATGPNSFDCSGLVSAAYKKAGVSVFPQTEVMARQEPKATGPDQPGDLWGHPGHVQMYLGVIDGKPTVVEAANPRDDIRIDQSGWMNVTWKLRPTAAGSA